MILKPALAAMLASGLIVPEKPKLVFPKPAIVKAKNLELSKHMLGMPLTMGMLKSTGKSVSFRAFTFDDTNKTTYTFTAVDIGSPASNRYIVVGVVNSDTGATRATQNSVTVGGAACTSKVTIETNGTAGNPRTDLWLSNSPVTSGSTADIVVTLSGTDTSCAIVVWAVYGITSTTPHATATDVGTTLAVTINQPAGGVLIALSSNFTTGSTATWTGATEDCDGSRGDTRSASGASKANLAGGTGVSLSVVWSSTNAGDQMCAMTLT